MILAKAHAETLGYTDILDSLYAVGETDFASTASPPRDAGALAPIGGGHLDDEAALAGGAQLPRHLRRVGAQPASSGG